MGGTSKQESQTTQQSQTGPWQPSQGLLTDILGGIKGQFGNYQPTGAETGAINTIAGNAANQPNYGGQATGLANDLMSGGTDANAGILSDAYKNYQTQMNPYASGANLDPTQAPGMRELLATIRNDVGNSVNGMFAGAGRDLSGLNQQTLARGIAQGEAAPLLAQYNQNVGNQFAASSGLLGAGGQTAQGLQGFNQQGLQNRATGLDIGVNGVPQAANAGAQGILSAEAMRRGLPLTNLGMLANLTIPIAGLGQQGSGTSNTQGSFTDSGMRQFQQFGSGFGSMFGGAGGGAAGNAAGMAGNAFKFFSDRRMKDDITQIGALYDGTPIYRFRYKGDPRVSVGLMADDVEQYAPNAVVEVGGYKMVDYRAATERAVEMGAQ